MQLMCGRGTILFVICRAAFVLIALFVGCAARPKLIQPAPPMQPNVEIGTRPAEVQRALTVFVDRFMPALAEACDYIDANSNQLEARAAAKARKVGGALAAMRNAVNPNPYAGLLDMVVMVTLLSDVADSPASKALYGPYGQRLSAIMTTQRKEVWALAGQFVTDAQLQELEQSIETWREAHPTLQYVSFVRLSDFPETTQIEQDRSARRANSVFGLLRLDPLSNLDPAVREFEMSRHLAERAFFYVQRMPLIVAWQTDQIYTEMLAAPEVQKTVSSAESFAGSTTRFAQATADFASTSERFQRDLPRFRTDTIREVERATERQRDAAIRQATTTIATERDTAIQQIAAALNVEQREAAASLDHVLQRAIEQLYWRAIAILCVLLFVFLVGFVFVRRFAPRPQSQTSEQRETHRNEQAKTTSERDASEDADIELAQVAAGVATKVETVTGKP